MSSKKKKRKKHSFKHTAGGVQPAAATQSSSVVAREATSAAAAPALTSTKVNASNEPTAWDVVRPDVRRALLLAGAFAALEVILWVIFTHTSVGPHIYNLVKI